MIESSSNIFSGDYKLNNFIESGLNCLKNSDEEVYIAVRDELLRQQRSIDLIASENLASDDILSSVGSVLINKYAEGYPKNRYYAGCNNIDILEQIAIDRLKKLFGAESANVQPHSGANANLAVYFAMLSPGDTVMGMRLSDGGHLTHGLKRNISGQYFNFVDYGVNLDTGFLDYDEIQEIACKCKPKMIVCGASAYPREIDFSKFRKIADSVNALLMADIAHIAGLVATGYHQSPVPYADFVTSTTQKTLRGPRGGVIMCKKKYEEKINKGVFPGIQGGPHQNTIAAKAICFKNAMKPEFKDYIKRVVLNCASMSDEFKKLGVKLVSDGTDTHLLILDLSSLGITGECLQNRLENVNIITNKETIPGEKLSSFITSGLRIGTPAITSRGMNQEDCKIIANLIYLSCVDFENKRDYILNEVSKLTNKYPIYM